MKRKQLFFLILVVLLAMMVASVATAAGPDTIPKQQGEREGCLACHEGIENIREPDTLMMQ